MERDRKFKPVLLAVDLGVKTAWALFDQNGELVRVESRNFGRRGRLKQAVRSVLLTLPPISVIVAEGPGDLAKPWFEARLGWETELVAAEQWRSELLWERHRRTGESAKQQAQKLAQELLSQQGFPGRRSLNHDGAEAVLLGLWAVQRRGWGRPSLEPGRL